MQTGASPSVNYIDFTMKHPSLKGFSGSCICGDYMYFSPLMNAPGQFHGNVARMHIHDFDTIEFCDVTGFNPEARGFVDTLEDGRYVYFIPYHNTAHHGTLLRYDTHLPFEEAGSWTTVDLRTLVHPNAKGFISGCITDTWMYLSPYQESFQKHHGTAVRYRLGAPIGESSSWEVFDMAGIHGDARGFHSAINSGDRIWFVPYVSENRVYHGHLMSFNTGSGHALGETSAWKHQDLTRVHPLAKGYVGGTQDGDYLYLAPYFNGIERHGLVLKYRLDAPAEDTSSWESFDLTSIHPDLRGFFGAVVHKNYVYFLPHCKEEGIYHGTLVRYDRSGPYSSPESWSYLDTTLFHPMSKGFMGCSIVEDIMVLCPYETATMKHSGLVCCIDLPNAPFIPSKTTVS